MLALAVIAIGETAFVTTHGYYGNAVFGTPEAYSDIRLRDYVAATPTQVCSCATVNTTPVALVTPAAGRQWFWIMDNAATDLRMGAPGQVDAAIPAGFPLVTKNTFTMTGETGAKKGWTVCLISGSGEVCWCAQEQ